jgi:hypothetical protein
MPSVTPKEPTPQVAMRAAIRSWGVVRTVALPEVKETSNPRNEYDPLPEGATVLDWDEHVITLKGTVLATTCDRSRCKGSLAEGEVSLRIPVSKSTRSKARHLLFHRDCFPFPELMKAVLPMIVHDTVKIVKIGERSVRTENGLLAAAPFESIRTYRSTRRAGIMVWGSKDSDTIIDSPWQLNRIELQYKNYFFFFFFFPFPRRSTGLRLSSITSEKQCIALSPLTHSKDSASLAERPLPFGRSSIWP